MPVPILKEPPITTREALIPYAMAGLNMLAPTIAARNILAPPQVLVVSILLILMGVPLSVYFRQRQYHRTVLNLIVMLPLILLTWSMVHNHPGLQFNWSDPMDSMMAHDSIEQLEGVLHVFTLLSAGRAFLLVTSADLLQTPLPGISIFLLAVITDNRMERDPLAYICLLVLFVTSVYLFSQEQSQQWFSIHTPQRIQLRLIDWTFGFCLLLFPLVFLFGRALQHFNLSAMAARANRGQYYSHFRLFTLGHHAAIGSFGTVEMGGANWPTGKQQIMDVELGKNAPQGLLWRSESYATYQDGLWSNAELPLILKEHNGWQIKAQGPLKQLTINDEGNTPAADPGLVEMHKEMLKADWEKLQWVQSFDVKAPMAGDRAPVFGAFQMSSVKFRDQLFRSLQVRRDGAVLMTKVEVGATLSDPYEVTSIIKPLPTSFHLKVDVPLSREEHTRYLQMPGGPDGEFARYVRGVALKIMAERGMTLASGRPFDIVNQFELYLGEHYRYTLTPNPPPPRVDPIIDFLATQKQGYCNYFSGAMVMLCRSIGLPARFVVGFATGDVDEKVSSEEKVLYHVSADQAHSWVEVYLPYYGWYTVDPTSGSRVTTSPLAQAWDGVLSLLAAAKAAVVNWWTDIQRYSSAKWYVLFVVIYLLVVGILVIYFRRERPPDFPRKTLSPAEARKTVLQAYQRMHRWLEMWGVLKPEGVTAVEFVRLFRDLNAAMGESVSELTALYIRAQYTDEPLQDADARQAITLLHRLWEQGKEERKNLVANEA